MSKIIKKAGDLVRVKMYTSGNLNIEYKAISSLEGCPTKVTGNFRCGANSFISLEGGPKEVDGDFDCSTSGLKSIKGCPEKIIGDFVCKYNGISSFEHFPKYIGDACDITNNKFKSFKNIHQHIEYIGYFLWADYNTIASGYSDLFKINGLLGISINDKVVLQKIVNKYLPSKDLINFQDEMIKVGFESYL